MQTYHFNQMVARFSALVDGIAVRGGLTAQELEEYATLVNEYFKQVEAWRRLLNTER
jgi:hypothetical protein